MITKAKFLESQSFSGAAPGCVALTANDLTVGWSNFSSLKSLPRYSASETMEEVPSALFPRVDLSVVELATTPPTSFQTLPENGSRMDGDVARAAGEYGRPARSRSSEPAILALAIPSIVLPCKARDAGDGVLGIRKLEEIVLQGMRRLARVYPDPVIKAEWGTRAEEFAQFLLISDDEESCC